MKRCPTCDKTFEDNLRFCQADGTPLVDAVEEIDPYKTMVARPGEIFAAIPQDKAEPESPTPAEPASADTGDDVLELPGDHDANKTQIVSEAEIRAEMERADARTAGVPPSAEAEPSQDVPPPPSPPKFIDPSPSSPPAEEPGKTASPFSSPEAETPAQSEPAASPFSNELQGDPFQYTTPPIPSPFADKNQPTGAAKPEPPAPPFVEPEPTPPPFLGDAARPEPTGIAEAEWTPPAAPDASWDNQELGQDTPFQPPPSDGAAAGQSKTLAIVSLVLGVFSILCCGFLSGIPAVIVGIMARGRAKKDPIAYGGSGLALVGIIAGILGTIAWIAFSVVYLVLYGTTGIALDGF